MKNSNDETFNANIGNTVKSGDSVVFSEEFKKIINDLPEKDWLWYIRNNTFEVDKVIDNKISIKGLHLLGFRALWYFNFA